MNEVKQFFDDVKLECLDHYHCIACPLYNEENTCILQTPPYLWDIDELDKIIERYSNG